MPRSSTSTRWKAGPRPPAQLQAATLRDRRDGSRRTLTAKQWVFALGPWTDEAMQAWFQEDSHRLRLSAGIHLWLDAVPGCERPWAIRRPKGRIIFAIPRDGRLQVGTTEREVTSGWAPIADSEREELYHGLEATMPAVPWRRLHGPRTRNWACAPSWAAPAAATTQLSREALLEHHPRFTNLRLVLGGKLTTARHLMDKLATELTGPPLPRLRHRPPREMGWTNPLTALNWQTTRMLSATAFRSRSSAG